MNASAAMNLSPQPGTAGNADNESNLVRSKVVVVEHDKEMLGALKYFIDNCNLVGYQARKNTVLSILKSRVDLGAIFLPLTDGHGGSNRELALAIHRLRAELPIFLRVEEHDAAKDLAPDLRSVIAGVYVHGEFASLKALIDKFLFNRHYPNEFVASVKEFTLSAFRAAFKDFNVEVEAPPYIVRDKIIYGELFSLLPLETHWCRGYMMLQSEEASVLAAITAHKTQLNTSDANFRHANELLAELANMIWGGFKSRYGAAPNESHRKIRVEVPIIINHARKFISFGADDPQLCFKFTLTDPAGKLAPVMMYEKFIFSLDWSPEKFAASNQSVNELVNSGELEMF